MNVKIIKLTCGEEIVGEITGETQDVYVVSKPISLVMQPNQQGPSPFTIVVMPYAIYSKDHTIDVNKSNITYVAEPSVEILNQYNSMYGNGIVLPVCPQIMQ
jgi:hypothetical protein